MNRGQVTAGQVADLGMSERGTVFIVSAPSGSGKSTLVTSLLQKVPNLTFSISYTTRQPRGGEVHGREYFFVDEADFERMIADRPVYRIRQGVRSLLWNGTSLSGTRRWPKARI